MKKLLLLFIIMISLVGTISGLEIDNTKTFNETDRSLVVHNAFNLPLIGSDIAKITPLTPHVVSTFSGANRIVAIFHIENFADGYKDVWKRMEFYNLKENRRRETREFFFKYKVVVGTREVPIYETTCTEKTSGNGTTYDDCNSNIIRYETVNVTKWIDLDVSQPLSKGNYTIKIITDVFPRDHMEFVPTWFGVRMSEYAEWTAGLNEELVFYYSFNASSGTVLEDDTGNGFNGTLFNMTDANWVTGKIGNALAFYQLADETFVNTTFARVYTMSQNFSFNFWYNTTNTVIASREHLGAVGSDISFIGVDYTSGKYNYLIRDDGTGDNNDIQSTTDIGNGVWEMHTLVRDLAADQWKLYINGISEINVTANQVSDIDFRDSPMILGARGGTGGGVPVAFTDGYMDEMAWWNRNLNQSEVTQLFNGGAGISYTRDFDTTPTVTLNSPINAFNSTSQTINFNGTVTSSTIISNVSLIINNTYLETNSSGINNTDYLFTRTLSDANYNWTYESCNDIGCKNATSINFTIDSVLPIINISSPINGQNFLYLVNLNNITLNTTITDTNLDTCWYEYNSTNTTFSCSGGVLSENNLTINNESVVIVWANDTLGQENSSTSDWTYNLFDFNDYTFDATITESSSTTFIGNFQTGASITSTFLEYNNTNNSVSIDSLGGNRYTLTSTLTTPTVDSDTNITWFFWVNDINATSQNQTVQSIKLDNCSSYTNYLVNYTLVDELTQVEINNTNSSIESLITLQTLGGNEIATFNQTFTGDSTPTICSEIQLNETGSRLWEQSRYGSDNYVFEQNNIQNASMTSLPAEITLRDLPSDSATTFRITYKSETFLAVPDTVINIQRKYIGEGVFKLIESPITDANGEVSASLDLDAVIYRIVVSKNGITLSTFENPAVACDNILTGDCTIDINEKQTINLINNFDVINDFNFGLTQDNRTITLTFEIPSGESKSVNLFVNQSTILGNKTSCNQTLLATSGQIQCVISDTLGDVFTSIRVSSDNVLITTASTTILEDRSQYFGTDNIVLTFFLVLSLVLLFISDPIAVLIGIIIGLISSGLMLFINSGSVFGATSVLLYLIVIVIIIIVKISVRQQR